MGSKGSTRIKRKYELFEHPQVTHSMCVRIKKGRYKGLVIYYGTARFVPQPDGRMHFEFHYTIVENPRNVPEDLKREELLGDILVDILDDELQREGTPGVQPMRGCDIEEIYPSDPSIPSEPVE